MIDQHLEQAIDTAGRERVFAAARSLGWRSGDLVPKWVWQNIVAELAQHKED